MAKILAPNKEYDGITAGIKFSKGVADCGNPYLIDWFKSKGYTVELDAAELKLPVPDPVIEPEETQEEKQEIEPEETQEVEKPKRNKRQAGNKTE